MRRDADWIFDILEAIEKIESRLPKNIDYDIGVSKVSSYEIKRLDSDYFSDE